MIDKKKPVVTFSTPLHDSDNPFWPMCKDIMKGKLYQSDLLARIKDQPADWYKKIFEGQWPRPKMMLCPSCNGAGGWERGTKPFIECSRCKGAGDIPYQNILGFKADSIIIDDPLAPDEDIKPDDPKEEQNIL